MKKFLIIIFLFSITHIAISQDISFFHRQLNDKFDMPKVEWGMTSQEFQLLSREVRLMDWFYGAAVPGYVHFRAKDYGMGYSLVATRAVGYAGLTFVVLDNKSNLEDVINGKYNGSLSAKTYNRITQASLVLIFGSFLFDMIHGNYRMKKKQELIRYKYSTKLYFSRPNNEMSMHYDPAQAPLFGLAMTF